MSDEASAPISLESALDHVREDVAALLASAPVLVGDAKPPNVFGVYIFLVGGQIMYAGEARGTKGLLDRLRKHISGDESHALQRAYEIQFPDRNLRRSHVKSTVYFKWLAIGDERRVSTVERALIWLYNPPWNKD